MEAGIGVGSHNVTSPLIYSQIHPQDWLMTVNPWQTSIFPNNIITLSREKVMRINKMITKGRMFWSFIYFCQLFPLENV